MTAIPLYSFPASMASLDAMLARVKAVAWGGDTTAALRAETALEELLTNSLEHGATAAATPAPIWFGVSEDAQGLRLRYEDAFAPFDPLPKIAQALARTRNPLEQRPPGGLGLLMVYRMADEFRYTREGGHNCIELAFHARRAF